MSLNKGSLEQRFRALPIRKDLALALASLLVIGIGMLLTWFTFKQWRDGRKREKSMAEEDKKLFGKEHPLNEDRPGFTPPDPEDLEGDVPPAQEASFLNMRTLIIGAAGLVGMIVFVHILAGLLFGYFSFLNPFGVAPPPAEPGNVPVPTVIPAAPTLQVDYISDLQRYRTTQEANLNNYGWVDQEEGIVRIPIERAMELVAEQGLPVTSATPQTGRGDGPDNSGFGFATPMP